MRPAPPDADRPVTPTPPAAPLSYEVDALRGRLVGIPANLWLDTGVLAGSTVAGITAAALLLPRLAK